MLKACAGMFMFRQQPGLQKGKHGYFSFRREMMGVPSAWKMRFGKEHRGKILEPGNGFEPYIFPFTIILSKLSFPGLRSWNRVCRRSFLNSGHSEDAEGKERRL